MWEHLCWGFMRIMGFIKDIGRIFQILLLFLQLQFLLSLSRLLSHLNSYLSFCKNLSLSDILDPIYFMILFFELIRGSFIDLLYLLHIIVSYLWKFELMYWQINYFVLILDVFIRSLNHIDKEDSTNFSNVLEALHHWI